jgi:hypothetical protein
MLLGEEGGRKNISQFLSARKLEQVDLMFFFCSNIAYTYTDDNNVILIENVLLIITFLVPKLDDIEIVLLTRGVADALSSICLSVTPQPSSV